MIDKNLKTLIKLPYNSTVVLVRKFEILYANTKKHGSEVATFDIKTGITRKIKTRKNLITLKTELGTELFVHLHKSFLVNLMYVKKYNCQEVVLINNEIISISRSKLSTFKNAIDNFIEHI